MAKNSSIAPGPSLAEIVAKNARDSRNTRMDSEAKRYVDAKLLGRKRLSYDQSIADLIARTHDIPTEEICAQLEKIGTPFDELWIEGPNFLEGNPDRLTPEGKKGRLGILAQRDPTTSEISFLHVLEHEYAPGFLESCTGPRQRKIIHTMFDVHFSTTPVTLSPREGIRFDEDLVLEGLTTLHGDLSKIGHGDVDVSKQIDEIYFVADFFARLLVILGSDRFPNNAFAPKTAEDLRLEKANNFRKRSGFVPKLPTTPIEIDLSKAPSAEACSGIKKVRELLGLTSVRRSKPIVSKYGKVFTRKPHERRIPSPVDRRNVEREIFSRDPNLSLVLTETRPAQNTDFTAFLLKPGAR